MADFITFTVPQQKAVLKALDKLPDKLFRKVIKGAVAKASTPMKRAYVSNIRAMDMAADGRESFAKSISKRTKTYSRNGVVVVVVGPRNRKDSEGRNWANLAHLFELGVRPHAVGKGSQLNRADRNNRVVQRGAIHPGIKPQPIARPAFHSSRKSAERIFRRELLRGIRRVARQVNRTGGRD